MCNLEIRVRGADAVRASAAPAIALHLEILTAPGQDIETVLLNCQIQIQAPRRRYSPEEQSRLRDLFGEPERWGQTLRPLLWANLTTSIPAFTESADVDLVVPCTFDLSVTVTKYFHAVENGSVPISLLFSGTVFYRTEANLLQAAPIPWNTEARFALPSGIWKQSIDLHYPNTAWLGLRRDTFERLYNFRMQRGLATFDEAIERMLESTVEVGA